jgi:hypothetical protein
MGEPPFTGMRGLCTGLCAATILLGCATGQTLINPQNVPWQQVNLDSCGIPIVPPGTAGTRLDVAQLRFPVQIAASPQLKRVINSPMSGPFSLKKAATMAALIPLSSNCWPVDLQTNAWSVINTNCTRCHGETGPPPDTLLTFQAIRGELGNLDLRTFPAMRTGGNRGPAVIPGDSAHSLIYLFTSLLMSVPPTMGDVQALDALAQVRGNAVLMPPYPLALRSAEIAALKAWIDSGCPLGK